MDLLLCIRLLTNESLTCKQIHLAIKKNTTYCPHFASSDPVTVTFSISSSFCCSSSAFSTSLTISGFGLLLVDCWYITPPSIQINKPIVPINVECLSQTIKLITTVNSLFTIPSTVKPVADMALRQENPKNEIARPNKHDNPTGKITSKEYQSDSSVNSCFIFFSSPIINNSSGKSSNASRLLYNTRPHVLSPIVITTCLM
ncbi:hypothetical protein Hanom_Chr17g01552161 [Helianthus anomalus]